MRDLTPIEERVLVATHRLGEDAYGMTIRQVAEELSGRPTSIGAVYMALERLEHDGLVRSWIGEASPERGGRAKKHFAVTGAGVRALQVCRAAHTSLYEGLVLGGEVS